MYTILQQLYTKGFGTRTYNDALPVERTLQKLEEDLFRAARSLDDLQFGEHPRLLQALASEEQNARNTYLETALEEDIKNLRRLYRAIDRSLATLDLDAQIPVPVDYLGVRTHPPRPQTYRERARLLGDFAMYYSMETEEFIDYISAVVSLSFSPAVAQPH